MSKSKVKVAVVGLGNMGRFHAKTYAELEQAQLVGLCDQNQAHLDTYCGLYHCPGFTSIETLISQAKPDAVSIAVSTRAHFDVAKVFLEHGIHVLVEKPICATLEEANALIALAQDKKCHLMVGHIERFNPAVLALKELVDSGRLGTLCSLISRRVGLFPPQIRDANVVIDLAVHDMDVITSLVGKQPDTVIGNGGRALIQSREDYADIFMTFGHTTGIVQVNWITPTRIRQLIVHGTKGYAELNYMTQDLVFYPSVYEHTLHGPMDESIVFKESPPEKIQVTPCPPLSLELTHFLSCVTKDTPPLIHGQVGAQALTLAHHVLAQF